MKYKYLIPTILMVLPLLSCSAKPPEQGSSEGNRNDEQMLSYAWTNSLKGSLAELVETADQLNQSVMEYCPSDTGTHVNDDTKLESLKNAWKATFKALKRQEIFFFGPYQNKSYYSSRGIMRLQLDYTGIKGVTTKESINSILNSASEAQAKAKIGNISPAGEVNLSDLCGKPCKGIPAMEYLIYDKALHKKQSYCPLLRKVSDVYKQDTKTLQTLWYNESGKPLTDKQIEDLGEPRDDVSYAEHLIQLFKTGQGYYYWMLNPPSDPRQELNDYKAGVTALINGLWQLIEFAAGPYRLAAEKGDQYKFSNMTLDGVLYNMQAFQDLVVANGSEADGWEKGTICYYVDLAIDKPTGKKLAPEIARLIKSIVINLKGIQQGSDSLSPGGQCQEPVKTACPGIAVVVSDMHKLQSIFQNTLLSAWNLTKIRSDADGD